VLEVVRSGSTALDKLRLVLVFYLSSPDGQISKEDVTELEKELKSGGADIAAFEFVRKLREISRMTVPGVIGGSSTPVPQPAGELFRALGNRLTEGLKERGLDNLLSGVKNLLPTNKLLATTRLTEALMEPSTATTQSLQETDEYLFLDPRMPRAGGAKGKRMVFTDGVVFIVGGASYVEYGNMEEWAKKSGKRVTYGGTEILDPETFIEVLRRSNDVV